MKKFADSSLPIGERAQDVVSSMTLEEKVSQLMYDSPAIPRLGIPAYHWWNECLHGLARCGVATVFPQPIGLAAGFDEEFIHKVACAISDEIRGKYNEYRRAGYSGIYKGITHYAPNINIFRDPRWGRGHETYGEDPYLTARIGVAFIKGLQGDHPEYRKVDATAKHFVVHSGPEELRHEIDVHIDEKQFRETYLYAFRECVCEADVSCVMGAYNRLNGEPCSGSTYTLKDILRKEWGFNGYVVSDSWAIDDFHLHHKITNSPVESSALAFNSGCDQNGGTTFRHLTEAVRQGLVKEEDIDVSVGRLFAARLRLGMFDEEEKVPFNSIPGDIVDCPQFRDLAREAAQRSIVLLKNRNDILPLCGDAGTIAVIGPNADSREVLLGNYSGTPSEYSTILQGIRNKVGDSKLILYSEGCDLYRDKLYPLWEGDLIPEAVLAAQKSDCVILCLGLSARIEGEEGDTFTNSIRCDRTEIGLPGRQSELLRAVAAVGKPVILVLCNGGPVTITEEEPLVDAVLEVWYPGEDGGNAVADVLFGDFNPCGRMPVTVVRSLDDLPPFEDYDMYRRTYRYTEKEPLYPFGFGLSYTNFEYSELTLPSYIEAGEDLVLEVTVSNTGEMAGSTALQVYLTDLAATVRTPLRQLVAFRQICLERDQSERVSLTIKARQMAVIRDDGSCVLEPGSFLVQVGGVQPDAVSRRLTRDNIAEAVFEMTGGEKRIKY